MEQLRRRRKPTLLCLKKSCTNVEMPHKAPTSFILSLIENQRKGATADQISKYIIRHYQPDKTKDLINFTIQRSADPQKDRWSNLLSHRDHLSPRARLGLERLIGKNPWVLNWKKIKALFKQSGYKAFQAKAGIDQQLYFYLVANGYYPVTWQQMHLKKALAVDILHDVCHGLAMLNAPYRRGLGDFAKLYLKTMGRQKKNDVQLLYNRFFECSYIENFRGSIRTISAIGATLEAFDPDEKDPDRRIMGHLGRFSTMSEWQKELKLSLKKFEK